MMTPGHDMTARAARAATATPPARSPFAVLGRFAVRFRYLIVAVWVIAALLIPRSLPSLSSVSNNNNSSFLPADAPSVRAAHLAAPFQRGTLPTAQLVAARAGGPLTAADGAAITRAEEAITRVPGVAGVRDLGVSGDGAARKALVELTAGAFGAGGQGTAQVDAIRATFSKVDAPAGLSLYLTGQLASSVDNQRASDRTLQTTELLSVVFILALLLLVYRSLLAPFLTLLPAGLTLVVAGPVIAAAHDAFGVEISPITQTLLTVLILGAGTDYGIFLVFRVREERRRGLDARAALVAALWRVGETITFSAGTVIGALLCLVLASLGFYRGLGPALAIGVAVMLLAGLTLTPALLAIAGRAAFWPSAIGTGVASDGLWGRIAGRIIRRPVSTLALGLVIFGGLALAVTRYQPAGFADNGSTSATSQSAQGTAVLAAHFPAAQANPTNLLLRYPSSLWRHPSTLTRADRALRAERAFASISGPLDPNGTTLSPAELARLRATLGPAAALPPVAPMGVPVSARLYNAYRATAQFVSPDGRTVQFYATLAAGDPSSTRALQAIPAVRRAVGEVAAATGAAESGVVGQAASSYDIGATSTGDIARILPVVLLVIAVLLAVVLRSLIAPLYLVASVGLSYLAALGLAVLLFMGLGGQAGVNFVLPFFMFIFLMALGSDYNILVMTRIREEAHAGDLRTAVTRAIGATGGTVTSAGLILAGSFGVLVVAAGGQIQQIGLGVAAGILMDTFLIRTLLIPSLVVLLGRWNWWPSRLAGAPSRVVVADGERLLDEAS